MDTVSIARLLEAQCGVISRRQVLSCGGDDVVIERMLRRREWARVHAGVYVDHTGPLTWDQRAWAAALLHWPAALAGASALRAQGLTRPRAADDVIELAVDRSRHPHDPPGVHTRRISGFATHAQMHLSPPRVRVEHAALTVASEAPSDDRAVAVLADVCQQRRSTPARLVACLRVRCRLKRRRLLLAILDDVASGAYSAMERRYLLHVERAHGLPRGERQLRVTAGSGSAYRDIDYRELRTVVELDGRLGHEAAADRWADLARDVDAAVAGDLTVRVGWRQVLDQCRLAAAIGEILIARGWDGAPRPCGPTCAISIGGGMSAPGAESPPPSAYPVTRSRR